jgi:hypothetical protein
LRVESCDFGVKKEEEEEEEKSVLGAGKFLSRWVLDVLRRFDRN